MTGLGIPPEVVRLADGRAAERGLTIEDLVAAGFWFAERPGHGWCLVADYRHIDGSTAERRLVLRLSKSEGNWRWSRGAEGKGAVFALGAEPHRAELVLFTEGESDTITTWRALEDELPQAAVIGVAGTNMVTSPANWVANNAIVALCFDADDAGDAATERAARDLLEAGIDQRLVRRLRPEVPGLERPDMRDLVGHLHRCGVSLASFIAKPDVPELTGVA
jgi:hypothetical protein